MVKIERNCVLLQNVTSYFSAAGSFLTGQSCKSNEEVSLIRKADLENHNKDGGFWTVIDGKVYDIKDFQAQSLTGNSVLGEIRTHTQSPAFKFTLYKPVKIM